MEIRQLRYFAEIADRGSFSRAARSLAVAQPALSRQIRLLEEELGAPLFYRNGRGVALTAAGEIVLAHARAVRDRVEGMRRDVAALHGVPQGTIALGLPPSVSAVLLRQLATRLADAHPAIKLHVEEGFSGNVAEWLQAGKVDLAIVYEDKRVSGLVAERLLTEELVLVHHPGWALPAVVDGPRLATLPLALPARPHGLRLLVEGGMAAAGHPLDLRFEMDSLLVLKDMAAEGMVATILSYGAVAREVAAGLLAATPLREPRFTRVMVLALAAGRPLDPALKAVVRVVREVAAAHGVVPSQVAA